METLSVSQLMSETDIIDILFRTCDSGNLGSVPVSSLITYIQRVTNMHQKNTEAVKTLSECLDPLGLDADVDLETYRQGMQRWIEQLGHTRTSYSEPDEEVTPQKEASNLQIAVFSPQDREFGFLPVVSPASGNRYSEECKDRDSAELEERVEDLQNTVRRLSQENNKLQAQVDVSEDCITELNQEKASLLEKIHRLQEAVDLQAKIAADNEELKTTIGSFQDQMTVLQQIIHRKDKEKAALADKLAETKGQLLKVTSAEEISHQEVENFQASIQYLTAFLRDSFEACRSQEVELANVLKENNKELLLRLADLQLNLNSLQQQQLHQNQNGVSSAAYCPGGDSSDEEGASLASHLSSTAGSMQPSSCASIQSEIKELRHPDMRQLPLCGKEQTEILRGPEGIESEDQKGVSSVVEHVERKIDCFLSAIADDGLDMIASPTLEETIVEEDLHSDVSDNSSTEQGVKRVTFTGADVSDRNANNVVNFRLKKLFALIKGLKEENERLRLLNNSVMNTMLCDQKLDEAVKQDSRVVILRDLLLEERTQKIRLQQQVKCLKTKYGLSNDGPVEADFGDQQNLFALQLQKIQQLERSNLLLAEKYHKAELKITDFQEEALHAAFNLEKEKRRCAKLEDSLRTSTLARQLDLRDIWRLVQKDVETEYLDIQEDNGMSSSTDELKEKILQGIKAMRDEISAQHETCNNLRASNPFGSPKKPCSHFKTRTRCCGRNLSPSSPLVDALTIDLFNGSYAVPRRSPVSGPYLKNLRMSCEDVDCTACRAVRLGLEFHGMASCPSLQLRFGHDCVGFNRATKDYNFNSETNLSPNVANSCAVGMYSRQLPRRQNPIVPAVVSSPAAQHRRLEFVRCCEHWASGTTDSLTSNSMDSNLSNASSARPPVPGPPFCGPGHGEPVSGEQGKAATGQSSPAGFRRMSFLAAVDKSKGPDGQRHRRPSYRAAIDRRFLGLNGKMGAEEHKMMHALPDAMEGRGLTEIQHGGQTPSGSRTENKSVTFQLGGDHCHALWRGTHQHVTPEPEAASAATFISVIAPPARATGGQARKLSILVEEDGEDLSRSPDRMSPSFSQVRCSSSLRNHVSTGLDRYDVSESGHCARMISSTDKVTTDEQSCPTAAWSPVLDDARLMMSEPFLLSLGANMESGDVPEVCGDCRMPAHFRQNSITGRVCVDAAAAPAPPTSASEPTATSAGDSSFVLVPDSPPQTPRLGHDGQAAQDGPQSRLAKIRQNNLAKKREQMKTMKMPELSEHAEPDAGGNAAGTASCPAAPSTDHSAPAHSDTPRFSLTPEDEEVFPSVNGSNVLKPPVPSEEPVTPSIPDFFLKQLGLSTSDLEMSDSSIDQLPDKELESRFSSLSLAFKTDRLTLDKRLGIQERSRDLTEENIDKELRGLREAVETLKQLCSDEQVKNVIFKIQHHLNILETSVARLSGRAEVFGAVQQEKRMSRAMEVMIIHTENIRRLREKEQSEVEEARKILSEKSQNITAVGLDLGGLGERRSASVSAALNNPRLTQRARSLSPCPSSKSLTQRSEIMDANSNADARRRSEVVLPRCFGGIGSPPLTVSSSMDSGVYGDFLHQGIFSTSRQAGSENGEEPRQRFQSATANVTVRNVVTNSFRRASLERQKRLSQNSSTSSQFSRGNSSDQSVDKDQPGKVNKQHSHEEEAYRQGYEEGLKASLGRELGELRDQQTTISSSLEHIMDRVDTMQLDERRDEIEETMARMKDVLGRVRLWMRSPRWPSASVTVRHLMSGLMFFLAMLVVIFTFGPFVQPGITLRHRQPPPL